jgi:hypothetical protein
MLVPAMPFLIILSTAEIVNILDKKVDSIFKPIAIFIVTILLILTHNRKFIKELTFKQKPHDVEYNELNTKYALYLKDITYPQARVGVFWAGTIPYYSQRDGVDFLGKSDKYIAQLEPYIASRQKPSSGLIFYPGHGKYDLKYTILTLQPDVIERADWGHEAIYNNPNFNYKKVSYKGVNYLVKKSSANIRWETVN